MSRPEQAYDFIWNGELHECEECHEMTEELFESPDLKHVCEGCLNAVDEDDLKEELCRFHVN